MRMRVLHPNTKADVTGSELNWIWVDAQCLKTTVEFQLDFTLQSGRVRWRLNRTAICVIVGMFFGFRLVHSWTFERALFRMRRFMVQCDQNLPHFLNFFPLSLFVKMTTSVCIIRFPQKMLNLPSAFKNQVLVSDLHFCSQRACRMIFSTYAVHLMLTNGHCHRILKVTVRAPNHLKPHKTVLFVYQRDVCRWGVTYI